MEGKSKMAEVLSQVAALGSKVDTEVQSQTAALDKLREEKAELLKAQNEALESADSASYVNVTKKIEDKQLLIEYSEKRLQQLQGRNDERETEIKRLASMLRSAAIEDLLSIDKQALPAIDSLFAVCEQAASVHRAYSGALTVLTAYSKDPKAMIGFIGFSLEHNSLGLIAQRLKNARQAIEAEIQRGK